MTMTRTIARRFGAASQTTSLLAVVPAAAAERAADALSEVASLVVVGDVAGVLTSERKALWRTRKRLGKSLVSFQQRLEALHAVAPTLPAAPGAVFDDEMDLERFLAANAEVLGKAIARVGDAVQHQIVIEAPGERLLARLAAQGALTEAQSSMAAGDRAGAGRLLQAAAEAERARLRADWSMRLGAASHDVAELPSPSEDAVLNLVTLSGRRDGAELEAVLEAIDAEWDGVLKIRMIGPSPASSFASILVERPELAALAADAQASGLAADQAASASAEDVKSAYRTLMKRLHPDVAGPGSEAAAQAATAAHRRLLKVARARDALRAAGLATTAHELAAPPLATLRREGDRREESEAAAA